MQKNISFIKDKNFIRSFLALALVLILFLLSAYFAQTQKEYLMQIIGDKNYFVLIVYILIIVVATVLAPLSTLALIPIISNTWGVFISALANIIGWFIGSMIAFYISRKYGRLFVTKIIPEKKINAIENRILGKNIFWTILLLRIVVPVDILSYILGLFKNISWKTYSIATFIGIIPFAIIFSYLGSLPLKYQILEAVPISLLVFLIIKKNRI